MKVDPLAQLQQSCDIEPWLCHDIHPVADMLVQHPVGDQKLIASRKLHLHQTRTKGSTSSNQCYCLAIVGMMRVMNLRRARNMGSVWVLSRSRTLRGWPGSGSGRSLAAL